MKIKPLADRILVKPIDEPEKKKGGIIIPDTAKEKPQEGELVAIGLGRLTDAGERIAPEVKKGDKVLLKGIPAKSVRDFKVTHLAVWPLCMNKIPAVLVIKTGGNPMFFKNSVVKIS